MLPSTRPVRINKYGRWVIVNLDVMNGWLDFVSFLEVIQLRYVASTGRLTVNDESENTWKEEVLAYFTLYLSSYFSSETVRNL